jgi:hypothetical protein
MFEPAAFGLMADDPEVRFFIDSIQAVLTTDLADAMDSARASALSGVYPLCTTGEVIELRRDAK